MAKLSIKNLDKHYEDGFHAVKNFTLDIDDKEFIVFVGPSGCGKSTTLRMIAGLEDISKGDISIDDTIVNYVPPKERNIAMVFQNYALYPHMTVYDNMAFGLKLRKVPKEIIKEKVIQAAEILGLSELLKRKPKELSGGQRQRVALGRAMVRDPKVFLLDEPLSNLDAKLRVQMRREILKLHQRLGATFIYVTHDQTEAMTMATRIVIMKDGKIQQVGTPKEVYENPRNKFVASFIGSPAMNFIQGTLQKQQNEHYLNTVRDQIKLPAVLSEQLKEQGYLNKEVILGIRPENISIVNSGEEKNTSAKVGLIELTGAEKYVHLQLNNETIIARFHSEMTIESGVQIDISFKTESIYFFDAKTENKINLKIIKREMAGAV
ncbi:ABC transporter ATP-binding protein [Mesobacillus stamsii]|uniref:Multiple sugar transport system ATP-binding protein n=1 Tax=Mesobacillus stamsii TaxID=225347 RepID=A0ABU0G0Q9_9BACI|nr:sn-glycerol-3-phosphate ABC transporter ATP-binding protein UgpC [Mesobacillus stamsii]MDQ0415776.1 multiple sugar transport system ATP-binding protein [Mesobacillus stamsii]